MTANDERVPKHYAGGYIHWDLVIDTGMGYLEGNATKYVARWRKKGGRADLGKAQHYVAKLREVAGRAGRIPQPRALPAPVSALQRVVHHFAAANALGSIEQEIIERIVCWQYVQDVDALLHDFPQYIERLAEPLPVPLTEENKHADRTTQDEDPLGR